MTAYLELGNDVRAVLGRTIDSIRDRAFEPGVAEDDTYVLFRHVALLVAAWEISESALQLASTGNIRAARILDRSVVEYGYRLHEYVRKPDSAIEDGERYERYHQHLLRSVDKLHVDTLRGRSEGFQQFILDELTCVSSSQIFSMIRSTLTNLGVSQGSGQERAARQLETEYAVSYCIAHGHHGLVRDPFGSSNPLWESHCTLVNLQSLQIIARIITNLIACLVAIEIAYHQNLGSETLLHRLDELLTSAEEEPVTVYTQSRMLALLIAAQPRLRALREVLRPTKYGDDRGSNQSNDESLANRIVMIEDNKVFTS